MSTTIKPRTASIVIYQGDDLAVLADLRRAADVADRRRALKEAEAEAAAKVEEGNPSRLLSDESRAQVLAREAEELAVTARERKDAYDAFVAEAAERAVTVRTEALGKQEWRSLLVAHAPRADDKEDAEEGYNRDTFPDALVDASVVEPEFTTPAGRTKFLDSLSEGDSETLFTTAYYLNKVPSADPKSTTFSAATPSSSAT